MSATLQKNKQGKWQNIGASVISDADGLFTFTATEARRGIVTLRIQVTAGITSEIFAIVIR